VSRSAGAAREVDAVDRTLVERAQSGDREAYEALARAVGPRLYLAAHRIVRDHDGADDAAQRALIAIWQELPSLRDLDRFDAWAHRLLVRFCLQGNRRARRTGIREVPIVDVMPEPRDGASELELRDALRRGLEALSPSHRAVLVLHHYSGFPLGEIAEILGVPYGTVGSRLHHAVRALRAELAAGDRSNVLEGGVA
jgi:RNA polymerase sigma-70 factor, ECF subfamily